jgi:hypothetical protein
LACHRAFKASVDIPRCGGDGKINAMVLAHGFAHVAWSQSGGVTGAGTQAAR